ncbi:MAG TPA: metallophosphoesterase family protein [Polyangiaceae bacterium]|nr:metallophosphoesterase family protein [Polyangiaceae bacterium]
MAIPATTGPATIDRTPYLQQVTSDAAAILFTTLALGPQPTLTLSRPSGKTLQVVTSEPDPDDESGLQRMVRLSGLEADTTYCYELDGWSEVGSFRTAPRAGSGALVRFVAFGDSGGNSRAPVHDAMLGVPFDLMLHVGDIAYVDGTLPDFEAKFFDTYADLISHVPIFPASGNHEYHTADGAPYRQVFALPENGAPKGEERWFSFDWGDVHFVALDTEKIDPDQAAWLEDDLSDNVLPWKVVYFHRPPYSSGTHGSSLAVRETFGGTFERFGVQLVLAGHDHDYERMQTIGGVTYVVTGGGGFSVRPVGHSDFTAYSAAIFHFVQVEVRQDELRLDAIDTAGKVFDTVTVRRTPE